MNKIKTMPELISTLEDIMKNDKSLKESINRANHNFECWMNAKYGSSFYEAELISEDSCGIKFSADREKNIKNITIFRIHSYVNPGMIMERVITEVAKAYGFEATKTTYNEVKSVISGQYYDIVNMRIKQKENSIAKNHNTKFFIEQIKNLGALQKSIQSATYIMSEEILNQLKF